jgi:glycosyltransferase involved in cell wall biosynthesis
MDAAVQIVLATYNGERFIRQQLDSLLQQSYTDFTILIRDDGSTDQTIAIVKEYQYLHPEKIFLLRDTQKNNLGAKGNFSLLLEKATADYIFLCDQDDIWNNDKILLELEKIKALENGDQDFPCMVYSDMKVINDAGIEIQKSLWKTLHLHPDFFVLHRLLIQNIPHGCSMVINKKMRNLACPIPAAAIMHDHWIALLAASCGKWDAIEAPTLRIRNHADNVTRKKASLVQKLMRFSTHLFSKKEYEYFFQIRIDQAEALLTRCQKHLTIEQVALLNDFIALSHTSGSERRKIIRKRKFFRTTWWHTLKMWLRA